jgi:hypothetical protein
MFHMLHSHRHLWCSLFIAAVFLGLALSVVGSNQLFAQTSPQVVQVEEDWELVVHNPDSGNVAPQVTCTISPNLHLNGLYSTFELNHKTVPAFAGGGLHLQTWVGEHNLTRKSHSNSDALASSGETVSWTSRMSVQSNAMTFAIVNGSSTTWGTFGTGTTLTSSYGTSLTNLNSYSSQLSVQNSGVGFAANRVSSLVLKRVRYTLSDGTVLTDDEPRVVHQLSP